MIKRLENDREPIESKRQAFSTLFIAGVDYLVYKFTISRFNPLGCSTERICSEAKPGVSRLVDLFTYRWPDSYSTAVELKFIGLKKTPSTGKKHAVLTKSGKRLKQFLEANSPPET